MPKGIRVTAIPGSGTAAPEDWYSRTTPCRHCTAKVLYRSDHALAVTITVQHQAKCLVLRGTLT